MTTRLRDLDDELGAAFRSAEADGPSDEAKTALLTALGLGAAGIAAAGAAGAATASVAPTAGIGATAAGGTTMAAKATGVFVALKWVVASAVVVGGAVTTVHYASPSAPAPVVVSAPTSTNVAHGTSGAPATPSARDAVPPPEPASEGALETVEVIEPAPAAKTMETPAATAVGSPKSVPGPSAPPSIPTLNITPEATTARAGVAQEITQLESARALLRAGHGAEAAAAIAAYRSANPKGTLAEEASVLEIESLASAGQRERAVALATRFAAAHPTSPLLPRVRAIGIGPTP